MALPKEIYYSDLKHDDFAGTNIETKTVDASYRYLHGKLWTAVSHVVYYGIAFPLVWFFCCGLLGIRIVNRKAVRKIPAGQSFFLYGNHTHFSDAMLGSIVAFPKRAEVISGPDAVSIRGIAWLVAMLGGLPIPSSRKGMERFMEAIETHSTHGRCITIFPEAHIWRYFTGIRPLDPVSFRYPVRLDRPVIAMCLTYQKRKGLFKNTLWPKRVLYVSDPILPRTDLPPKEAQRRLRDAVQEFLERSAVHSDCERIRYIHRPAEEPHTL